MQLDLTMEEAAALRDALARHLIALEREIVRTDRARRQHQLNETFDVLAGVHARLQMATGRDTMPPAPLH